MKKESTPSGAKKKRKRVYKKRVNDMLKPRQVEFIKAYMSPSSDTYNNAKRSAMKAGFSETYANQITAVAPDWLQETTREITNKTLVDKAIQSLDATLSDKKNKNNHDATKFTLSKLSKDFQDKEAIDITSAGLPIQDAVVTAMLKVYGK
jgi:hypothetical protein